MENVWLNWYVGFILFFVAHEIMFPIPGRSPAPPLAACYLSVVIGLAAAISSGFGALVAFIMPGAEKILTPVSLFGSVLASCSIVVMVIGIITAFVTSNSWKITAMSAVLVLVPHAVWVYRYPVDAAAYVPYFVSPSDRLEAKIRQMTEVRRTLADKLDTVHGNLKTLVHSRAERRANGLNPDLDENLLSPHMRNEKNLFDQEGAHISVLTKEAKALRAGLDELDLLIKSATDELDFLSQKAKNDQRMSKNKEASAKALEKLNGLIGRSSSLLGQ